MRRRIRSALSGGQVIWSGHAETEMRKAGITKVEGAQILRSGIPAPGELERDSWRYRVETRTACLVVTFLKEPDLVVVTAWRRRR